MTIDDRVYGRVDITEPVLLELIAAPSVQRLKRIGQFSLPDDENKYRAYSRYEHSVGVMLLLRRLGASFEEQIAGLLHDVSHTAFSHLIDWVLEGSDPSLSNYQDLNHDRIIQNSELPEILRRHGLAPERITDYHNFGLLERELPDLCADRVDYSLREFHVWAKPEITLPCLNALRVVDGQIVFADREHASQYARTVLVCLLEHWAEPGIMVGANLFSKSLRLALTKGVINLEDFMTDDETVLAKLRACPDAEIQDGLRVLRQPVPYEVVDHDADFTVKEKFRAVDPLFLNNEKLTRLSEVDANYAATFAKEREKAKRGLRVLVLPW